MSRRRAVSLVGIGDDGCVGLMGRAMNAVMAAQVLVGGERHLAFFPEFGGERIVLGGGIGAVLDRVIELSKDRNVCILASGDPLFFGVGSLVIGRVGADHVEVIPQLSAMQLAFARVGLKWDDAAFVSLHGRPIDGLLTRLRWQRKVAILTDESNSPARIAGWMVEHCETSWRTWVCENVGGPGERVRAFSVVELAGVHDVGPLNLLLIARSDPNWRPPTRIPFLHEDAFARRVPKNEPIIEREVRVLSLAALAIRPDGVVWGIGAGSGSVSIEAALLAPEGRVYAIEVDPEDAEICRENLCTHGVDNVRVVEGSAPAVLSGLETPDAVFVGGSRGSMREIIDVALERLRPGGRLVINMTTLENAAESYQSIRERGLVPEVTLLQVSRAAPLAHSLRYEALNPTQVLAVTKPGGAEEEQ